MGAFLTYLYTSFKDMFMKNKNYIDDYLNGAIKVIKKLPKEEIEKAVKILASLKKKKGRPKKK